jgi:aldehyde dehydrogenase (NAD+)
MKEPLGVVLIVAPWNYPFQLLLKPLVGAIAAGNCVVLKSSEFAPATSALIKQIINETFDSKFILFIEGDGAERVPKLMNGITFDHIFFTGSTDVGRKIYQQAAAQLIPVTLELGGKSPGIVEADADIEVAARRIALTKFSNVGQMCVAPDYLLVHDSKKEALIKDLKVIIEKFFTSHPQHSNNYGKIINEKQFNRIVSYFKDGKIIHGGVYEKDTLFIAPTLMIDVNLDAPLMKEEIFGPILPIISYKTRSEALAIISKNKNPLAFYVFTSSKKNAEDWLQWVPAGGGCINNTAWHLTNHHLPFGGRGNSGIGQYQGKNTFETFSHRKSILKTPTWFDPAIKYPPYKGKLSLFKKLFK